MTTFIDNTKSSTDKTTILIYLLLVVFGWINIYSTVHNNELTNVGFMSHLWAMQLVWIGVGFFAALSIMLIDQRFYHMLAYPLYLFGLVMMVGVAIFGREVNGAKAWLDLGGGIRIQPVEFMKIFTALALARFVSAYNFNIKNSRDLFNLILILMLPILMILMQNDTGSALVFLAFFLVMYREGFAKILYILAGVSIVLFLLSFLLNPFIVLVVLFIGCVIIESLISKRFIINIRYVALIVLTTILVSTIIYFVRGGIELYYGLLISIALSLPILMRYSFKHKLKSLWNMTFVFIGAFMFTLVVDYAFENVLQTHQQKRILDMLGLENDPRGLSYNVIQAKIAVGSGGVFGKGFLQGTQTKFNFVPEQSTDFIFCTVGEEWGFLGSLVVIGLFTVLIIRLMRMGERQSEPFGRIYCYSVAAIFFMHFAINIMMVIGLFPVVGIPLPFFSYGGSSFLSFTILLFIALRLDSKANITA